MFFIFQKSIPNQIDKFLKTFWWGEQDNKNNFHTIRWSQLCKLICDGGLGIRDIKTNNLAPLVKIC